MNIFSRNTLVVFLLVILFLTEAAVFIRFVIIEILVLNHRFIHDIFRIVFITGHHFFQFDAKGCVQHSGFIANGLANPLIMNVWFFLSALAFSLLTVVPSFFRKAFLYFIHGHSCGFKFPV